MPTQDDTRPKKPDSRENKRREGPKKSSPTEVRQQRVDEYEVQGLKNPEAFEACFAAIQADQIRIGFALGEAVKQVLSCVQTTPQTFQELEPSLSIYLRVTRQIERYRQLELRQAEVEQVATAAHVHASETAHRTEIAGKQRQQMPK